MTTENKIELLEDMLELDRGTLEEDTVLNDLEEWDSLASVSLIALLQENFNKRITVSQISEFITVKDILDYME